MPFIRHAPLKQTFEAYTFVVRRSSCLFVVSVYDSNRFLECKVAQTKYFEKNNIPDTVRLINFMLLLLLNIKAQTITVTSKRHLNCHKLLN